MFERELPIDEGELERGVLEDGAEHVGKVMEDHGAPDVILEIDEVGGARGERPGVGEILTVGAGEFADGDVDHGLEDLGGGEPDVLSGDLGAALASSGDESAAGEMIGTAQETAVDAYVERKSREGVTDEDLERIQHTFARLEEARRSRATPYMHRAAERLDRAALNMYASAAYIAHAADRIMGFAESAVGAWALVGTARRLADGGDSYRRIAAELAHSADVLRSPRSDSSTLRDGAAWARSTAAAISKAREAVVVGVAREANLPAAAPNDLERTSKALEQAATLTEAAADDLHRAADAYEAGR